MQFDEFQCVNHSELVPELRSRIINEKTSHGSHFAFHHAEKLVYINPTLEGPCKIQHGCLPPSPSPKTRGLPCRKQSGRGRISLVALAACKAEHCLPHDGGAEMCALQSDIVLCVFSMLGGMEVLASIASLQVRQSINESTNQRINHQSASRDAQSCKRQASLRYSTSG